MKNFIQKLGILALEIPFALTVEGAMIYHYAPSLAVGLGGLVFGGSIGYTLCDRKIFQKEQKKK